ncbi:response regulator transcription factor [Paenibacillus sp. Root444D2]|uniref:response regulator transcription factor n=1 Tax=Paenibacillus sp. Root444D2 TaxID=1736538 RepID=UPI00070A5DFA|nr:response regulator [Paenibacillus sp. Root444D2]KQX45935.1 AraC family transcriptional regulator [Paenibacillus sp. Root444D2]
MLQLLIVDDEILVAEAARTVINWEKFGVTSVFTAYNIRQAKEKFDSHSIDIMFCDIEMPQGNGLELMSWVRDHYPETVSIIMTCHADFKFAQQAVQLGSFDYLLKPVPPDDMENIVVRVIDKINKESELMHYSQFGHYWFQHQPLLVERFWLDIIHQSIPPNPEAIKNAAEERNIPFSEQMKFIPILISVQRYYKELNLRDEKLLEFALKNCAEEVILAQRNGQIITLTERKLLAILPFEGENPTMKKLKQSCESYIASCNRFFYCDISCYIGHPGYSHELSVVMHQLSLLEKNNVACNNKAFLLSGQADSCAVIPTPDMNLWSVMLKDGSEQKLLAEAEAFLERLINTEGLNAKTLYQFQQDFLQMVYYVLKLKGIQARQLFSDTYSMDLTADATRSVLDIIAWINHMISKAIQYVTAVEQSQSIVEKVIKYISLQLDTQDMSREEVANHVFLNPDYLDRTFKKETGMSVTEYLVQERLKIAQELLTKSDMTVTAIAAHVGYSNVSHFSRRFKKLTRMNPNEYRQLNSRNRANDKSKMEQ